MMRPPSSVKRWSGHLAKRIVLFSSQGPGNFQTVLDFCAETRRAKVVHLICDRPGIPALDVAAHHGIPASIETIPGRLDLDDPDSVARRIRALMPVFERLSVIEAAGGRIDLIVLAFRKVLGGPILDRFGSRIINIHPSDLSIHNVADRRRRYVGINGLKLAIADGNECTRTSVHRVDGGIDTGELLCLGPAVRFRGDRACSRDIVSHEQVQKDQSDRPALTHALHAWLRDDVSQCAVL
jgi:phosphoribosylglycinamide formyltransferase 1